ncbi:hypothetical protein, conserved [Trypanosoma brucei brucei TREU927]|uniref:Conserved oligomeric Golgi complex subunit 3 n=1 Tax=Trypanosoma brucei brucei (strain 927/4 GUTat10.1) TaxID=185431 RepID=Q38AZ0_TRYB2|nr:hypothetical protein, conserved [Trypanosoma brucei brucei TREU927]EAN78030.1 hypothetical protein, conserved [Trypanosoma brucei brucei TREU927]
MCTSFDAEMLTDAEFSRLLDISLAPLSKSFQHALPISYATGGPGVPLEGDPWCGRSFPSLSQRRSVSMGAASKGCDAVRRSVHEGDEIAAETVLRAVARTGCETAVEGLQQWLERARHGRQMGERCLRVLKGLVDCLDSMRGVTVAVQEQSNKLSSNASELMVRKARLEMVQEELQRMIKHFSHIDALVREVEQQTLSATSQRYSSILQEMEEEMQFLTCHPQFLSTKAYTTKLAAAYQQAYQCLKDAIIFSIRTAQNCTLSADVYRSIFYGNQQRHQEGQETVTPSVDTGSNPLVMLLQAVLGGDMTSAHHLMAGMLASVDNVFCARLNEKASLRRLMEAHGGGRQPFEETNDDDIFDTYRDARVLIIGPVLKNWLEMMCGTSGGSVKEGNKTVPQFVGHLVGMMKLALEHEKEVFDGVWLREDFSARLFPQIVSDISGEEYHVFRSHLLQVDDLEVLAQTIEEIQRASAKQYSSAELSGLLTKMIQDTQERLVFRTSVFLRHSISQYTLTRDAAQQFLNHEASASDTYIPALTNCVTLLQLLYPSLEFPIFSVFAEEAINCTLLQVQELSKLVGQQAVEHAPLKGILCQLRHLLHLRDELSLIDENIIVVEKGIDLSKIALRRLEIVQSSRESKKDVESEIKLCTERAAQAILTAASSPLIGIARKAPGAVEPAVECARRLLADQEELLTIFITHASIRNAIMGPVRSRMDELLAEADTIRQQPQERRE